MGELPGALVREGFQLLAATAGPVIGGLLVIGLIVGVFQAATQINDPAVGFLPRMAAAVGAVFLLGGWLMEKYSSFFSACLHKMSGH
jgi:flagellar biosynthesis protein FliQ